MDRSVLARKPVTELKDIAAHLDMKGYQRLRKADLIDAIIANANGAPERAETPQSAAARTQEAPAEEDSTRRRVRARRRTEDEGEAEDAGEAGESGDRPQKARKTEAPDRREKPADAAEPEGGSAADEDEDEDEDEDDGRRRRTRRERRRRQRERTADAGAEVTELRAGVLDILPEGYGFLRTTGYLPGDRDAYISQGMIRKHGLRRGDVVQGPIRPQRQGEKVPALQHVQKVNGKALDDQRVADRRDFRDLTPLFPSERLRLETPDGPVAMRIIDLIAPIGKGQRGLIVSPPKAGKTTLLKGIGQAITANNPECHLMVVLVDERPEEVTDMERSIDGEVIASTFDRPADEHTQIAELALERAKRLVELGHDVVILLDSVTRLARAYNLAAPASGRIMSGGVDSSALYPPKRFFGAARNLEEGGSLTIIASALVETGSKMDEVIFEEFKGTGNCEIRLDRRLEQKRIFPAIDVEASGTRKEELLLDADELEASWKLRRVLHALEPHAAMELLIDKLNATDTNDAFLVQIARSNA